MIDSSPDTACSLPKKKTNILWWIGGIFLLLFLLFLFQLFGPSPRIIVSKQTTYITEPLGRDGLPDYEKYVLERSREGVTPENNAAVLLWQAIRPGDTGPFYEQFLAREFGLPAVSSNDAAILPLTSDAIRQRVVAWLRERDVAAQFGDRKNPGDDSAAVANFIELASTVIDEAITHPWTDMQIPPLGQWITDNQEQLDLIVAASRRTKCYFPSPTLLDTQRDALIHVELPGLLVERHAARYLKIRAMYEIGEGRLDAAWENILAIFRLGRLVGQGRTIVDQLVAMSLDQLACQSTAILVDDERLTLEQAQRVRDDLAVLARVGNLVDTLDNGERLQTLDAVLHIRSDGPQSLSGNKNNGRTAPRRVLLQKSIDWNGILIDMNRWYDRLVTVAKLPTREQRIQATGKLNQEFDRMAHSLGPSQMILSFFSRSQRSEMLGNVVASLLLPALQAGNDAQDRTECWLDLTRVAAALAVYRAEHGVYPATLVEVSPVIIKTIPLDVYSGQSFIYRRDADMHGYVLYSAYLNGRDDGGTSIDGDVVKGEWVDEPNPPGDDQSDLVIRLPIPPLKLPKQPD